MEGKFICQKVDQQLSADAKDVYHSAFFRPIMPKPRTTTPGQPAQVMVEPGQVIMQQPVLVENMSSQPYVVGKKYKVTVSETAED